MEDIVKTIEIQRMKISDLHIELDDDGGGVGEDDEVAEGGGVDSTGLVSVIILSSD